MCLEWRRRELIYRRRKRESLFDRKRRIIEDPLDNGVNYGERDQV